MTLDEIRTLVCGPHYNFLQTNEHLKDKIVFLTLGGSYAYGTNIESSDIDIRGCALNSTCDLLGLSNFEQVVSTETDTTVYAFNKLIKLLADCNPNTIEMLGCKPEHYIYLTDMGKELISNRKMFLSKRAIHSFGGYANQQLRRLENAIARDRLEQSRKEEHILSSLKNSVRAFEKKYTSFEEGSLTLFTADSNREDLDKEIFANIHIDGYPARQFTSILNDLSLVIKDYDKLNKRNHKKDSNHLNKHAMHLARLYLTCFDILEKKEIVTYRSNDIELLASIRRGDYQNQDGSYRSEFFEIINSFEQRLKYDANNTDLPDHPDMKMVEEFVMSVNRRVVGA